MFCAIFIRFVDGNGKHTHTHTNTNTQRKHKLYKYQKLLEIEKEVVREVARGDKPYLRKSKDRKAQISPLN